MEDKARVRLAWTLSVLLHALFFLFVFPGRSPAGKPGVRVLEVGLVELKEEVAGSPSVSVPSPPPPPGVALPGPRPVRQEAAAFGQEKKAPAEAAKPQEAPSSPASPVRSEAPPGGERPGGPKFDFGTGEGLVLSHPLSYPKSAQNEGVEGTVRLTVLLSPMGRPQAELVASSGDRRLDSYALRAVVEAWRYDRPPVPVRLEIELVFARGEVRANFLGSTPLPEEGTP